MNNLSTDKVFSGSIPKLYDIYLVPMIFEPYAVDIVNRLQRRKPSNVLEIAAGTGVVTRALATALPPDTSIIATDLNQAMLDQAMMIGLSRKIEWRQADAMQLPFADAAFDAVACQFGAMFFPDKAKAFSEVCRVLKPGGIFIFNVWDRLEENEFADVVTAALATVFPTDPPRFMARTPHGYYDHDVIKLDLAKGGFTASLQIDTVVARSRAASASIAATAYCQGTPLRNEIEARDATGLETATNIAALALANRFGSGPVEGKISAHIVCVER